MLRLEFMEPAGLSAQALAKATDVLTNHRTAIMHGTSGITANWALRLTRHFGTSTEMWMNLQTARDGEENSGLTVSERYWANIGACGCRQHEL